MPNQINTGLDPITQKKETLQYLPPTTILKTLLQHNMFLQLYWKIILVQGKVNITISGWVRLYRKQPFPIKLNGPSDMFVL